MDAIYIGVDFHARQQTICYLKTETGELVISELQHKDKAQVRAFYQQFQGYVIVGLEASGYSPWFEAMLEELGHQVWLGDATESRRRARWRQKSDRRDAELIWDLMVHNEFPLLHQPAPQSREILRLLRYRQKLIKVRTMSKNSLQAIALQAGLAKGSRLFTMTGKRSSRPPRCLQLCNGNASTGSNCSSRSTNNCWKQWSGSRLKAKTIR
jgi:transposase